MKYITLSLILLLSIGISKGQVSLTKANAKVLKRELKDMVVIPKGNPIQKVHLEYSSLKPTPEDSTLLFYNRPLDYNLQNFLISNHEVTNYEYKEFVWWVTDSIQKATGIRGVKNNEIKYTYYDESKEKETINIFAKLEVWNTDFGLKNQDWMTNNYFTSGAFDTYPILGISYEQVKAYINWKNNELMKLLEPLGLESGACFYRLPKEAEWVYVTLSQPALKKKQKTKYLYSGQRQLVGQETGYRANFGKIKDKNNFSVKGYYSDGFMYTSPIKSFKANDYGIYDLAGNVAEYVWSEDALDISLVKMKSKGIDTFLYSKDSLAIYQLFFDANSFSERQKMDMDSLEIIKKWFMESNLEKVENLSLRKDLELLQNTIERDYRILELIDSPILTKGGSWLDSPVYLNPLLNQVFSSKKGNSRVGFRLAMSIDSSITEMLYQ